MDKKRSVGVTIFGILLLTPAIMFSLIVSKNWWYMINIGICITLSYGILKVRNWARIICIWLTFLGWGYFLYLDLSMRHIISFRIFLEQSIIYFVPSGLIIFYLTRPKVKEQFR